MRVSLGEIEAVARKAALGSGLPFGLAEEAGTAARFLSRSGFPQLETLTAALNDWNTEDLRCPPELGIVEGIWRWSPANGIRMLNPLSLGPSLADHLLGAGGPHRVVLEQIGFASLVPGFLSRIPWPTRLAWGQASLVIAGGRLRDIRTEADEDRLAATPTEVVIERVDAEGCATAPSPAWDVAPQQGVEVDDHAWHRLEAVAAKILVPDSEVSRLRGAGAGLIDSD